MANEINHNIVKQQIVDILQANTDLYDISDFENKITYLEVGEPNGVMDGGNGFPTPPTFPALWVTNSRTLETILRKGITSDNQHTFLTHEVRYMLKMLVNEQDSIVAEKRLDDLQQIVMETLEEDVGLWGAAQWDPAVSYVIGDKVYNNCHLYEATAPSTNEEPPNASFWDDITTMTVYPNDGWPERVETFRIELDGSPVRGRMITWQYLFTTN